MANVLIIILISIGVVVCAISCYMNCIGGLRDYRMVRRLSSPISPEPNSENTQDIPIAHAVEVYYVNQRLPIIDIIVV